MKSIARESIAGIISALVVAAVLAFVPTVRDWVWNALTTKWTLSVAAFLVMTLVCLALGALLTYMLLRKTILLGRKDVMTQSLRASQIDPFIERRITEAKAKNSSFGVLLVDIDNFKQINDDFDHEIGNHTLAELVDVIRPRSPGEEIFRYGGDEFLLVTNIGVDERGCWGFSRRIVRDVAKHDFLGKVNSRKGIRMTVSCGCLIAQGNDTVVQIRRDIVIALKRAKSPNAESPTGKNSAYLLNRDGEQDGGYSVVSRRV
jgi:diguanylate cyclase (GGDEF)-like protein